jgi:hypothetical protein
MVGYTRSQRRLVFGCTAEFFEGERNRSDLALTCVPHEAKHRTRIYARGQKDTDLNVGQQVRTHAFEYSGTHLFA